MSVSPRDLTRVSMGWRVKSQDGVHLDVRPMLRGMFRLAEVPVADERDLGRYWCFASFEAAVLAAMAWDVTEDTAPVGWVRSGGARH